VETKLLVITMVGGLDLVGEIVADDSFSDILYINRPVAIHATPEQPGKLTFVDVMKTGIFRGDTLVLKTSGILWSGPPAPQIEKAYAAIRAGIVLPSAQDDLSVNQ
jgi:hypothetical protein